MSSVAPAMRANPVREKLRAGGNAFGVMAFEFFTPGLAPVLAASGAEFVLLDMEHSGVTEQTLDVYRTLRDEGRDNVGIVIQSYLRRSLDDVRSLAGMRPTIVICHPRTRWTSC